MAIWVFHYKIKLKQITQKVELSNELKITL